MKSSTDQLRQFAFMLILGAVILTDGGVPYSAAALMFSMLSVLLLLTAAERTERSVLRRLRGLALFVGGVVTVQVVLHTHWDETGRTAHSVWRHLVEEFGEQGGTPAVTRLQAIWELPGALIPLVGFSVSIVLHRHTRAAERFWTMLAMLGGVFAAYGVLQQVLFPTWHFGDRIAYVDSLTGFYVNRNAAAAFLMMTSLATVAVLDRDLGAFDLAHWHRISRQRSRWTDVDRRLAAHVCLLLLEVIALFLTKSRAGSVLGVGAISVFLFLRWRDRFSGQVAVPQKRMLVLGLILVGLLLLLLSGRVAERYDLQGLDDSRWCVYPAITRLAVDSLPWGVGLGGFTNAFSSYRQASCGIAGIWDSAHDLYLQGLVTMGLVFPVIILLLTVALFRPITGALGATKSSRPYAQATVVATATLALHSLVDFPLEIPGNALVLAVMLASSVGISTDRRRWRTRSSHRAGRTSQPLRSREPIPATTRVEELGDASPSGCARRR